MKRVFITILVSVLLLAINSMPAVAQNCTAKIEGDNIVITLPSIPPPEVQKVKVEIYKQNSGPIGERRDASLNGQTVQTSAEGVDISSFQYTVNVYQEPPEPGTSGRFAGLLCSATLQQPPIPNQTSFKETEKPIPNQASPKEPEKPNLQKILDLSGIKLPFPTVGGFIGAAVPILMTIAGILLLLYLIWGGISWMLSQGDPKAIAQAQARITTAIIGFVIIFVAYWLVQILGKILQIAQFEQVFR
jgi:hypothetical protein